MDYLQELGSLALASRMKRTVDHFRKEVKSIYEQNEIDFEPALMPLMKLLGEGQALYISEASKELGISQPAVTQFCNKLHDRRLISIKHIRDDQRKRQLHLTGKGHDYLRSLEKIWQSMSVVIEELLSRSEHDLIEALSSLESQLNQSSFSQTVQKLITSENLSFEILEYHDSLAKSFEKLNHEWIEKHFVLEETDRLILSEPKSQIIDKGGYIFFVKKEQEIIGTVALLKVSENEYEIAKMAVTEKFQKKGVGKALLDHVIQHANEQKIRKLILFSHTHLAQAINMYFSRGFRVIPKDEEHNNRANIKMQLTL